MSKDLDTECAAALVDKKLIGVKMDKPKIVPIGVQNLCDIPDSLINLADRIEKGLEPRPSQCIVVLLDGNGRLGVTGYGEIGSIFQTIGILQAAVVEMSMME